MNELEHLMTIGAEECAEIAQRLSKALRFGLDQVQHAPDDKPEENPDLLDNRERIRREYNDLTAVLEMIDPRLVRVEEDLVAAKQEKIERYLKLSAEHGTLQESARVPS